MSYANMVMYGAVIPSYKSPDEIDKDGKKKKKKKHERVNGDDPRNREKINKELELLG
jgi:hypothetical protein